MITVEWSSCPHLRPFSPFHRIFTFPYEEGKWESGCDRPELHSWIKPSNLFISPAFSIYLPYSALNSGHPLQFSDNPESRSACCYYLQTIHIAFLPPPPPHPSSFQKKSFTLKVFFICKFRQVNLSQWLLLHVIIKGKKLCSARQLFLMFLS